MTPERWQLVKDLLHAAWERDTDERSAFLDEACSGDPETRSIVEALLASDENIGEFLEAPAKDLPRVQWSKASGETFVVSTVGIVTDPGAADSGKYSSGRRIGPYRILREIGHGGMGSVYLAERADGEYRKRVAIKLIKTGLGNDAIIRRFRNERQVLADLDHPNIARLVDGGASEDGLPYLVMDHVEGVRIDIWCDTHKLNVRDRLRLFQKVCAAVQYAHDRQVIHRDLKPGNILVTADGTPKLLDFGIAKVLNPELTGDTVETTLGLGPMTPDYASPEQMRGGPVGPPSDTYALGVVLYELLAGRPCGQEPVKLSVASSNRQLAGDLDSVVLKALRKEPERRYTSVAHLSEDLDRFLQDRPVQAREPRVSYRGQKFLKRHRVPMLTAGFTAALVLAIAAALGRSSVSDGTETGILLPLQNWISSRMASGTPRSLAVVQIENRAQDPSFDWMDRAVCELLITNLANAKAFQVISAERMRELIGRQVKGEGHLPPAQAREVAREAHADLFLSGALTKLGARVRLGLRIQDTATGHVIFTGKVDSDKEAVFALADEAAARILAHLTPREAMPKPNVAAALTSNVEALRAYEEGLSDRTTFRQETQQAFQRAIDLDPQFVLAHYYLADWMRFSGNVPEARRTIARAVQLAGHATVPRLQKLLIQALQLRLDLQLDEAAKVLETAHREFAREIEPLYQLANLRSAEGSFAEAATLLEEAVRMDERYALAHDQLGYQYAFVGDVTRAVASINRYAALLPPGNVVPFCSRADVYLINERYDKAIAQYRKIEYWPHLATAAIHAGNYALSESSLDHIGHKRWAGFIASGDLEAARGQLDRAVRDYEEAAKRLQPQGPLRPWFALLTVARIFLEQGRPKEVLSLGQRDKTPWAAGLRGTAYLLLHQEADAEKEFATLRQSIAPILGDYVADKTVEFHRMQAASYEGRFDRVIQIWPGLPRSFWSLYALDVGRAYLESGVFTEAEHHLRLAWKAQLASFWNSDMQAQHNFLTSMLAQFYLAQVQEKTERQNEAIANYQQFLNHFEHSSAQLPQIPAARAALARVRFSERGKLLFSDNFLGTALEPGWVGEAGTWEIGGGAAKASEPGGDDQPAERSHALAYHDAIFEFSFRLDGASYIGLRLTNKSGNVVRLWLRPQAMALGMDKPDSPSSVLKPEALDRLPTAIELGRWHKVVFEVHGQRMIAQLDGKQTIAGVSPRVDVDKTGLVLFVSGGSGAFNYVRVYEVSAK